MGWVQIIRCSFLRS